MWSGADTNADMLQANDNKSLICKIWSKTRVKRHHAYKSFKSSWGPLGKLDITEVDDVFNTFKFTFQLKEDKKKVWDKTIWNIDGSLMVLCEYNPDLLPKEYDFILWHFGSKCKISCLLKTLKKKEIACSIGKVVDLEFMPQNEILSRNARAKIELNVLKSIPTGKLLKQNST